MLPRTPITKYQTTHPIWTQSLRISLTKPETTLLAAFSTFRCWFRQLLVQGFQQRLQEPQRRALTELHGSVVLLIIYLSTET